MNPNEKEAQDYKNHSENSQLIYGKKFLDGQEIKPNYHVLDVGCGTGNLSAYIAQSKVTEGKVSAFDPDPYRIKQAEQEFHEIKNLSFNVGKATEYLEGKNDEFDFIYSNMVMHWIPKEQRPATFQAMCKALRPGCIMTHLFTFAIPKLVARLSVLFKPEEYARLTRLADNQLTEEEAESYAKSYGLEIVSIEQWVDESKFKSVDKYLGWLHGSIQGLIDVKERYYSYEGKVDLDEGEDGSVVEETKLMAIIFRK